jgi:uncharacterized protein
MPFLQRIEDETPEDVHVVIKKSTIKGAGKGIFAKHDIKKGITVAQYIGVMVPMYFVDLNFYDSDYIFQSINELLAIDANDPLSCYGRYANDSLSQMKINVKFTKAMNEDGAKLIAIKDIKKGDEIFISYGYNYWSGERLKTLPPTEQVFVEERLRQYIDSIHVESDSEEDDSDEDEDYDDDEEYDSDR